MIQKRGCPDFVSVGDESIDHFNPDYAIAYELHELKRIKIIKSI